MTDLQASRFDGFVQLARAALLFSFPGPKSLPKNERAFLLATDAMRQNFFRSRDPSVQEILVRRPVIDQISSALRSQRGVLLTGERGSGKSTSIYAALHDLGALSLRFLEEFDIDSGSLAIESNSARVHIHFNCNFIDDVRDESAGDVANEVFVSRTVAQLFRYFDSEMARSWDIWKLANCPEHASAAVRLRALGSTPDQWNGDALHFGEAFAREWADAESQWKKKTSDGRCLDILDFVVSALGKEVTICIDNSDHLSLKYQAALVDALASLRRKSKVPFGYVVSLRPETERAIHAPLVGDASWQRLSTGPIGGGDYELVQEIIRRRLTAATSPQLLNELQTLSGSDAAEIGAQAKDVLAATIWFIRDYLCDSDQNRDAGVGTDALVAMLEKWYNGSIRLICLSLVEFVVTLLQDQDPVFPLRLWLKGVSRDWKNLSIKAQAQAESLARTALYNHVINHTLLHVMPGISSGNANVFVLTPRPSASVGRNPDFRFMRLRILQFMANEEAKKQHAIHQIDVSRVCRIFHTDFGVPERHTRLAIAELAFPRFPDDSGLIRIDGLAHQNLRERSPAWIAAELDREGGLRLELLPAGRMLTSKLIYTCEYLFLSLVHSGKLGDLPGRARHATAVGRDFRNTHQRVLGAAYFVHSIMLPSFQHEHPYADYRRDVLSHEARKARLHLFQKRFGFGPPRQWMVARAIDGLKVHATENRYLSDEYSDVRRLVFDIEKFIKSLNAVSNQRPAEA